MSEFTNRMMAQRIILKIINSIKKNEELFGLSQKAIDRWVSVNRLDCQSRFVELVKESSEKLFFLANKSQEQITDEYQKVSYDLGVICEEMKNIILKSENSTYPENQPTNSV